MTWKEHVGISENQFELYPSDANVWFPRVASRIAYRVAVEGIEKTALREGIDTSFVKGTLEWLLANRPRLNDSVPDNSENPYDSGFCSVGSPATG